MPTTFKVSDVPSTPERFDLISIREVLALRGVVHPESSRATAASVVDHSPLNGLILAIQLAFGYHLPLVLSPDDVWACVTQGVAYHVAASSEAMRPRFVRHTGQMEVRLIRDEFIRGRENDWASVVDELIAKMQQNLLVSSNLLVGEFSTTGPIERMGPRIALLSAMQSYFRYVVETRCGIPEVTLLGTVEDWISLRARAALLQELDLEWWMPALLSTLDEFVSAASGHASSKRWESLYKINSVSGDDFVSGWILGLFPYVEQKGGGFSQRNPYVLAHSINEQQDVFLSVSELPPGTATAPFVWEYLGESLAMDFGTGMIAVAQDPDSGALRVVHGWWVAPRASEVLDVEQFDPKAVRLTPRHPERLRPLVGQGCGRGGWVRAKAQHLVPKEARCGELGRRRATSRPVERCLFFPSGCTRRITRESSTTRKLRPRHCPRRSCARRR